MRPFWWLFALLGIVAAAVLAFLLAWPGFRLRHVSVQGNHVVPTDEILRAARVAPGQNIWLENRRAIAGRIGGIPYVESVWIHRLLPDSIAIVVRERVPFAVLQTSDDDAIVDRSLRVLQEPGAAPALPVFSLSAAAPLVPGEYVRSKDAIGLRNAYDTLAGKGMKVSTLTLDPYGDLVAELPSGLRLLLGDPSNLEKKLALAGEILSQVARKQRSISALDLRAPSAPVIVYR
jgi:cell division protein FtsQ